MAPPRIAFSTPFNFDLQRFTTWTLTQDSSNYTLTNVEDNTSTITKNTITNLLSDSGVTAGDTIQLGQDKITISANIQINKNLTFDLNGKTIEGGNNYGVFQVGDDWGNISATLTIEDSVGGGKINYTGTGAAAVGFGFGDNNKFVMNGGSIESNTLIFNNGVTASITITNGTFKATNTDNVQSKLSQDAKFIYLDDVLYVGDNASSVAPTEFSLERVGKVQK